MKNFKYLLVVLIMFSCGGSAKKNKLKCKP